MTHSRFCLLSKLPVQLLASALFCNASIDLLCRIAEHKNAEPHTIELFHTRYFVRQILIKASLTRLPLKLNLTCDNFGSKKKFNFSPRHPFINQRFYFIKCLNIQWFPAYFVNNADFDFKVTVMYYCVVWWTALYRVWCITQNSHCMLIPLTAKCLPNNSIICQRYIPFVLSCLNSDSHLYAFVHHGIFSA